MISFKENRALIENEFETADFSASEGVPSEAIGKYLESESAAPTEGSIPLKWAGLYAYVLDHARLEFNAHTIFSVKMDIGVDYSEFAKADVFESLVFWPQRSRVLSEKIPEAYDEIQRFGNAGVGTPWSDFWHTVPDWPFIIKLGFPGILAYARNSKEKLLSEDASKEQVEFLDSVITCYEAILRFLERAYRSSEGKTDEFFRSSILRLMNGAPENTYDLMQFQVLFLYFEELGTERARSLGRVDQLYLPYMEADLKNGVFTKEEIKELWRFFMIHFTATKRFAQQPITICGSDEEGNDMSNDVTRLILDVYDELKILDPKLHVRYHKNIAEDIFRHMMDMIRRGQNSICMVCDETVYAAYERIGIPKEDASKYVILGCYEPVIPGIEDAEIATAWLNLAKVFEVLYNDGCSIKDGTRFCLKDFSDGTECKTFDEFLNLVMEVTDYLADRDVDLVNQQSVYNTIVNPAPMFSSTMQICLDTGRDVHTFPLKYNNISFKFYGLATLVDSLSIIKKYVYDEKRLTLSEFWEILRNNWEGQEELRRIVKADRDKYGCNRDMPDAVTKALTDHIAAHAASITLPRGGHVRVGLDSIDHCIKEGRKTGATPDGRLLGESVSKNLCASANMDREGVTAFMQSVLKIDATGFLDAAPCDYVMHPSAVAGTKGLDDFCSLVRIFFSHGGFALHGNVLQGKTLVEAQAHPEQYKTLQIRVCGWNEYFVKMSKEKQDFFIRCYGER